MFAGFTVALAATPVELVKVQLQMQFHNTASSSLFSTTSKAPTTYISPLGFAKQIYSHNGITGFWHALPGTMLQRMWFGVM